jgi:hypothetical protein
VDQEGAGSERLAEAHSSTTDGDEQLDLPFDQEDEK